MCGTIFESDIADLSVDGGGMKASICCIYPRVFSCATQSREESVEPKPKPTIWSIFVRTGEADVAFMGSLAQVERYSRHHGHSDPVDLYDRSAYQ
jgi:hypothetical protein